MLVMLAMLAVVIMMIWCSMPVPVMTMMLVVMLY